MKARIAWLPGDGVGPEVLREARRVLDVITGEHNHEFEYVEADIGGVAIERHGEPLPKASQDVCLTSDAVFLGAVGDPRFDHLPPGKKCENGLLDLRKLLGNYANLRPVSVFEALVDSSPLRRDSVRGVDLMIVRELLGGIYFGSPRGLDETQAFNTEIYTRDEIQRIARVAFKLARHRRRRVRRWIRRMCWKLQCCGGKRAAKLRNNFPISSLRTYTCTPSRCSLSQRL